MPELPEVETIKLGLQQYLVGHKIEKVEIRLPKQFVGDPKQIMGAKIISVRRFGKGLIIDLSNNFSLAIHIKLTGQLIYENESTHAKRHPVKVGTLPGSFTHVIFHFDKNARLFYNDIRQFGWIKVLPTNEVLSMPYFKSLGPEPLRDLTLKIFSEILSKRKIPIKLLLMDQKVIAGVGNIYANDALWLSKINPARPSNSLTDEERKRLFDSLETVLKKGLKAGGASEWQYVNALGEAGEYQNFFEVYGKTGKPCKRCGTKIERTKQAGRGTFFCPACQRNE